MAGLTGVSFPHGLGGEQEAVLLDDGVVEAVHLPVHRDEALGACAGVE